MTISDEEMRNRMQPDETRVDPFQVYRESLPRSLLIEPINLMRIPSSRLSRDLRRDFTQPNLNNTNLFCRLASKNMVTRHEPDHDIFYLTETNKLRAIKRTIFNEAEEVVTKVPPSSRKKTPAPPSITTAGIENDVSMRTTEAEKNRLKRTSIVEVDRKEVDATTAIDKSGRQSSSKKRGSTVAPHGGDAPQQPIFDINADAGGALQFQPHQLDEFLMPPPPQPPQMNDTTNDQSSLVGKEGGTSVVETTIIEKENAYELIIIEYLEAEKLNDPEKKTFLKEIIYNSKLTSKCEKSAKPRRLFAIYLFSSMMSK